MPRDILEPTQLPSLPRSPLPPPSEPPPGLAAKPLPNAPPALFLRLGIGLRRALLRLADLVAPPYVGLMQRGQGIAFTSMLGLVARYGIADVLTEGPMPAEAIGERVGLHTDALHRVLRALSSAGIFRLRSDGRFENNRLSRALVGSQLERMREWAIYFGSQSNVAAWNDLERTVSTGENAFERAFGVDIWKWFDDHPDEREMFAQAMMGLTIADAPAVSSLYPFQEVQSVCDVGGGRGTLLSELLLRHPHLRGTLVDREGVLASARGLLQQRGVNDRVELVAGSFFERVPAGADAYLLKTVLHDWSDEHCTTILRNVRAAMQPGQRVVLVELALDRNESEAIRSFVDVLMMVACSGGRERSVEELRALLRATGFTPARVFAYPTLVILEGIAAG